MNKLKDYSEIAGQGVVFKIKKKILKLKNKHIVFISSTYQGGGVAEMLNSIVPLFNIEGLNVGWRVLHGTEDFFSITKKIHNGLQGEDIKLSESEKKLYYETNKRYSKFTHLNHDLVVVHDPQPMAMIDFYKKKQPWILRLHIDLSSPNKEVWNFVEPFILKYDEVVVSSKKYFIRDTEKKQRIIYPAIDPLSDKNKLLTEKQINDILNKYDIKRDKPLIVQISRFDKWKDPLGVIDVFEMVRQEINCQLVLLGSMASDDPEGMKIYEKVKRRRAMSPYYSDIHLVLVNSNLLVNALQRASTVIIQKSKKEGFGLVVTEALYKGKAVVASDIGGISLQIENNVSGILHNPNDNEGFANSIKELLRNPKLRDKLGRNGKKKVIKEFLITRLMDDWLNLFLEYLKP